MHGALTCDPAVWCPDLEAGDRCGKCAVAGDVAGWSRSDIKLCPSSSCIMTCKSVKTLWVRDWLLLEAWVM